MMIRNPFKNAKHELQDVFAVKVGGEPPLTYVKREYVDDELKYALGSNKSVILYGASKQGKTSLWRMCIKESAVAEGRKFIQVSCQDIQSTKQLYESMLKRAGYDVEVSRSESYANGGSIRGKGEFKITSIASVGLEGSEDNRTTREFNYRSLESDFSSINDVSAALDNLGRIVFILEDFHYIPDEVQKQFSLDLQGIVENSSCTFIIVGAWSEGNQITLYNGEMAMRIASVRADRWTVEELREVIGKGENLLNVEFTEHLKERLTNECRGNISILQEVCSRICRSENIEKTQEKKITIEGEYLDKIVKKVLSDYDDRYDNFIRIYSAGNKKTQLQIRKRILNVILNASEDDLIKGISYENLTKEINEQTSSPINSGNITQALDNVVKLQKKKNIKPIVIGYNKSSRRLTILDPTFITWLRHQSKERLLEMVAIDV